MCKTIKQTVKFKASPAEIYSLLTSSKKHSSLTGDKAVLSKRIGGSFSALSGFVTGIIVDLSPGKRIVQAWRTEDFPSGIFSMASLQRTPAKKGGTQLVVTHRGVPKILISATEKIWRENYCAKLKGIWPGKRKFDL